MATSFLKSFMEAVNPIAGQSAQKARDPQSRKTEKKTQPEAETNVLFSEALEDRSSRPEIIVIPQTEHSGNSCRGSCSRRPSGANHCLLAHSC